MASHSGGLEDKRSVAIGGDQVIEGLSARIRFIFDEVNIEISSEETGFFGFGYCIKGFDKEIVLECRYGGGRVSIYATNKEVFF